MEKYYLDELKDNLGLSKQGMYDRLKKLKIETVKERAYITEKDFKKMQEYMPIKTGRPKKEKKD